MSDKRETAAERRRHRALIWYTIFLALMAVAVAIMPLGTSLEEETRMVLIASGAGAWIGLIGVIFWALRINSMRKGSVAFRESGSYRKRLGIIHFFGNRSACIADGVLIASVVGFVVARYVCEDLFIPFLFLAIFVFGFGMHCMLNGINYQYIKFKSRRGKSNEF